MDEKDKKRLISHTNVRGNVRYITITDNCPNHWDELISILKSNYSWWAYIFHDKDDTDKHIHLIGYDKGGTSLKAHCERFKSVVPSNFVCKVYNPRAMARYLVHKDNPEKFQYDTKFVQTNCIDKFYGFLSDENHDIIEEYRDFCRLHRGQLSVEEYLEKYRSEFCVLPMNQKVNLFSKIFSGAFEPYLPPKVK